MMDLIELEISKTQSIRIYLPCKKEELESFDYVTIKYLKNKVNIFYMMMILS